MSIKVTQLPVATTITEQGAFIIVDKGVAKQFNYSNLELLVDNLVNVYSLPTASTGVLGGVKVDGITITIDNSGTIHSVASILPIATTSILGGVKIGSGVNISGDGTISVNTGTPYTLTTATSVRLGGVKIGSGVTISGDGTISVSNTSSYTLTSATTTVLGGVKIGNGVQISSTGSISVTTYNQDLNTSSNVVYASLTLNGNQTFTGANPRIQGNFSDPNWEKRTLFQTFAFDSPTEMVAIPNGYNQGSSWIATNSTDTTNFSSFGTRIDSTNSFLVSNSFGTGVTLPLKIVIGNIIAMNISTAGNTTFYSTASSTSTGTGAVIIAGGAGIGENLNVGGTITANAPFVLPSYTTSTLSTIVSPAIGSMVFVTNASGGAQPCYYDGSHWYTVNGRVQVL